MATKAVEIRELESVVRRAGTPENADEAAKLADAATEATANIRKWMSDTYAHFVREATKRKGALHEGDFEMFASSVQALAQQLFSLQLQVADITPGSRSADMMTAMRYLVARRAFASDADMAETLGVHRSQVARWKHGSPPDAENAERLVSLDVVVSLLMGFLESESIPKWLRGINAHLGNKRPIDVLREGKLSEVIRAIESEKVGAFA